MKGNFKILAKACNDGINLNGDIETQDVYAWIKLHKSPCKMVTMLIHASIQLCNLSKGKTPFPRKI